MQLKNKIVFITGAGSGIGRALAIESTVLGAKVIISDINRDSLDETISLLPSGSVVQYSTVDVGDRDMLRAYIQKTIKEDGPVDIVINNAGTSVAGKTTAEMNYDDYQWLFNINMWGVLIGSKEFLPHFQTRPEAYIVNISSVFGIIGFQSQSAYCMTKFAVKGLTETLHIELKDTNIKTLVVHPGGIDTNIVRNSRWDNSLKDQIDEEARKFSSLAPSSPKQAALTILKAIQNNKNRVRIGSDAKLIDRLARLSPSRVSDWINRHYEKKAAKA